jgi:hypothetical protein
MPLVVTHVAGTSTHSLLLCRHAEVSDGVVAKAELLPLIVRVIGRTSWLVLWEADRTPADRTAAAQQNNSRQENQQAA